MGTLGFALLLAFGGILAAAIWVFVVGFAGVPGAMLSAAAAKRSANQTIPVWGLFLTVAGQLYAALVFVALVIHFVAPRLSEATGFGKWVVWVIAFMVGVAPPSMALKDAVRADPRNVQHLATTFTAPLTAIGFLLFVFVPALMKAGWGWVPRF